MKTFIRVGAWYQSDTAALNSDLDISDLIAQQQQPPAPPIVSCTCSQQIEELKKQVEELTLFINKRQELPTEVAFEKTLDTIKVEPKKTVVKKVAKAVVKKSAPKKK